MRYTHLRAEDLAKRLGKADNKILGYSNPSIQMQLGISWIIGETLGSSYFKKTTAFSLKLISGTPSLDLPVIWYSK